MYRVGDKIAHPMHGAGIVEDIIEHRVDGEMRSYYVVTMTFGTMKVMVPCEVCAAIGVREIIDAQTADELIAKFVHIDVECNQNWNKRYRENMLKIKSGDLMQVASVIKSLTARDKERNLSTGERKLLSSAKQILISEIMLAKDLDCDEAERIVIESLE